MILYPSASLKHILVASQSLTLLMHGRTTRLNRLGQDRLHVFDELAALVPRNRPRTAWIALRSSRTGAKWISQTAQSLVRRGLDPVYLQQVAVHHPHTSRSPSTS